LADLLQNPIVSESATGQIEGLSTHGCLVSLEKHILHQESGASAFKRDSYGFIFETRDAFPP